MTAIGVPPTRPTAGRWFNLMEELRDTEGDLWISRQGEALRWTVSLAGPLRETLQPADRPDRTGPEVWVLETPCRPWSDRDGKGRRLEWKSVHPKARDFLSTEATFQRIANDRSYADYARALVAGEPLSSWHTLPLFAAKAAEAKQSHGRIFTARERTAARMAQTMLETVTAGNGQTVERRIKVKTTTLSAHDCEALLLQKLGEQENRCALTRLNPGILNPAGQERLESL